MLNAEPYFFNSDPKPGLASTLRLCIQFPSHHTWPLLSFCRETLAFLTVSVAVNLYRDVTPLKVQCGWPLTVTHACTYSTIGTFLFFFFY